MYSLTIRQQDNPKITIFHLRYLNPALNAPISLNFFSQGLFYGPMQPLIANDRAVWARPNGLKIFREFQDRVTRLLINRGGEVAA